MGTIKDRNCKVLTEAEEIKRRCQEYTEELYKKGLNDWDNHDGVITHLEPVFIPILKKGNATEFSNYCTVALTSHASKVMLKILQARI